LVTDEIGVEFEDEAFAVCVLVVKGGGGRRRERAGRSVVVVVVVVDVLTAVLRYRLRRSHH